jgi:hypothetical protein
MATAAPISIRFPAPLRAELAATAAAERRSFSGQVVVLLEGALEARRRTQEAAEQAFLDELARTFDAQPVEERR